MRNFEKTSKTSHRNLEEGQMKKGAKLNKTKRGGSMKRDWVEVV